MINDYDLDIMQRKKQLLEPISILDLLFIDVAEDLPWVIEQIKIVIKELKKKLTEFCKNDNLLLVIKMRDFYYNLQYKLKELELRTAMPLLLGIFMLQQLKKQLKNQNKQIKNLKLSSQLNSAGPLLNFHKSQPGAQGPQSLLLQDIEGKPDKMNR